MKPSWKQIICAFWGFLSLGFCINTPFESDIEKVFMKFIHTYNRHYLPGSQEYKDRFNIFKHNLLHHSYLNKYRSSNETAWYGVNTFSDMSEHDFEDLYLSDYLPQHTLQLNNDRNAPVKPHLDLSDLPQKVDWRKKSIVSRVQNQKSCGACWAFAIVQTVEGMYALKTGKLVDLSVQQVIDCSFGYRGILSGCKGGDTCNALQWLIDTKTPLLDEKKYPLQDKTQYCKMLSNDTRGVQVVSKNCVNLVGNEKLILNWLALHGPIAVAVDATNWNNYLGGIVQYHCGQKPNNHAVEVIGYDLTGEIPYYIAKNSWGTDFGNKGYIYIAFGNNVCGIAKEVVKTDV